MNRPSLLIRRHHGALASSLLALPPELVERAREINAENQRPYRVVRRADGTIARQRILTAAGRPEASRRDAVEYVDPTRPRLESL